MGNLEVTINELFVIEVFRNFRFLTKLGYHVNGISIYYPEPGISYKSDRLKRGLSIVTVHNKNLTDFYIYIELKSYAFSRKKNNININQLIENKYPNIIIPKNVNEKNIGDTLKIFSTFIQENLSSTIQGKEWDTEYVGFIQKG